MVSAGAQTDTFRVQKCRDSNVVAADAHVVRGSALWAQIHCCDALKRFGELLVTKHTFENVFCFLAQFFFILHRSYAQTPTGQS